MLARSVWDIGAVVTKWLELLAMAGVIGGGFSQWLAQGLGFPEQQSLRRYLQVSALLGLIVVPMFLLMQIGGINQAGFAGMFDSDMGKILLQSDLGQALRLRELAFAMMLAAPGIAFPATDCSGVCRWSGRISVLMVIALLVVSFALTGHVSTLPLVARTLLVLHVLTALVWIGSLYPLLQLGRFADVMRVQQLMRRFGRLAVGFVAVLVGAGGYLAMQMLSGLSDLWATDYGHTLLLKLAGASALLAFAATNKLVLVPRLPETGTVGKLLASIKSELVVALLVVAATSWLTTLTSPSGIEN